MTRFSSSRLSSDVGLDLDSHRGVDSGQRLISVGALGFRALVSHRERMLSSVIKDHEQGRCGTDNPL